jgi:hypothetical protein
MLHGLDLHVVVWTCLCCLFVPDYGWFGSACVADMDLTVAGLDLTVAVLDLPATDLSLPADGLDLTMAGLDLPVLLIWI